MKKFKCTPVHYIYLLFSAGILALLLSLIFSGGSFLENIVFDFSLFIDFFDHIRRFYLGLSSVYEEGMHACFPPLAYCMYYLISRILYKDNIRNPEALNISGSGLLVLCMLMVAFTMFFVFALFRMYQSNRETEKKWLAALFMCSYPFWLAIERGNMSLLVLILLMYAMILKDSDKKWERETALLLFAAAAALKLYPAVFGLLYLIRKRYKEAGRLIIYGLLLFFLPFIFFDGWSGFKIFFHNITAVGSGTTGVTIVGIFGRIAVVLGMSLKEGHEIGRFISYLYFIAVLLYCFYKKESWKSITLLTSLMIVFVPASGTYCLIYCVIPFVCFMNELIVKKEFKRMDYVYATIFVLIFAAYPIQRLGSSGMLYTALYLLIAILLVEQAVQVVKSLYRRLIKK